MYRKGFRLLAAASVCVALALLSTPRLAQAVEPETVEITFGLEVWPVSPLWEDPPPELSDFVSEDTVVILIGALHEYGVRVLHFPESSPPCGDFEVAGTEWVTHARGTIVNKGGQIGATVYALDSLPPTPAPPAHSALVAHKITQMHACWLWFDDSGYAIAQDTPTGATSSAFFIVTGEFRVKQ